MSQNGLPTDKTFNWLTHRRKNKDLQFYRLLYVYTTFTEALLGNTAESLLPSNARCGAARQNIHETEGLVTYVPRAEIQEIFTEIC
jgi:hypothetical protein